MPEAEAERAPCPGCGYLDTCAPDCTVNSAPTQAKPDAEVPGQAPESGSEAREEHAPQGQGPNVSVEAGFVHAQPLPSEGAPGPGLVEGLCEARSNIDTVPKNGWNSYLKHEYATYDDVMGAVGPALADAGVWAFESVEETKYVNAPDSNKGGSQMRLVMIVQVLWTDGQTRFKSRWVGTSIDSDASDKHEYKLYSQLLKYAYAKTLKIETGDPDIDDASAAQGADQPSGDPNPDPAPTQGGSNGATRLVQVHGTKPGKEHADVRKQLKNYQFQWNGDDGCWEYEYDGEPPEQFLDGVKNLHEDLTVEVEAA